MSKLGPIWTWIQFVWSMRGIIAIFSMLMTIGYLLASETLEQRRTMLAAFSASDANIAELEDTLSELGNTAFAAPSRDGSSITATQAQSLYSAARTLRSELATLSSPTSRIESGVRSYTTALADLQGALNLFEEGGEGTIAVLSALDRLEAPASVYRKAVRAYKNSVWRSFWAAF